MRNITKHIIILLLLFIKQLSLVAQPSIETDNINSSIDKAEELLGQYEYEKSLEVAKEALLTAKYNNDDGNQARILTIIGKIYELDEDDEKAISNYKSALINAKYSKSEALEVELRTNLGRLLMKTDSTLTSGIRLYIESYSLAKRIKDTAKMIQPLLDLSAYYISKDDYTTAYREYLSPARILIGKNATDLNKSKLNVLLGKYFLSIRRYQRSEEYFKKGITIALQKIRKIEATEAGDNSNDKLLSSFYQELTTAYQSRSNLSKQQQKFEESHNHLEGYIEYDNKYRSILKAIELQRANIKFNVGELKEQVEQSKVDQAERESEEINWQISIILGIVLILISLAFLISSYKNNMQKRKLNNDLIEKNKELIKAKETAEQVSTLKSQFISTVSHELRTPLYGVIGLTSLLMEDPEDKKKSEYLESLKFSGDYLLALINDVLQLSKIETNEVKLEKVSFALKPLVEGIVNSLRSKQQHNNNTVHIDIDSKIKTTLLGDSIRLSQILINLIGNALKFTKNGNIWIKVKCLDYLDDNYKLQFIIKDDGIGIPKSKQKTIFESFAQVKNQNQEYEGTGLGLAIVRKLVHLHDSEIIISSEEGVGSKFTFDLSYEKAIKETDNAFPIKESLSIGTSNFNILVVDDNKINQIVTQNILKKKGYTCDVANNGMKSIEMLKSQEYDLVLMDINMPEMNGLDATTVIRTFNTHIPIIALTAVEEGEIRDQALSAGMNDVIIKPYDTQQFFQTIMKNISNVQRI